MQFELLERMSNHRAQPLRHIALALKSSEREVSQVPASKRTEDHIRKIDRAYYFPCARKIDDKTVVLHAIKASHVTLERRRVRRRHHPWSVERTTRARS